MTKFSLEIKNKAKKESISYKEMLNSAGVYGVYGEMYDNFKIIVFPHHLGKFASICIDMKHNSIQTLDTEAESCWKNCKFYRTKENVKVILE